jgi:hypothetical protein
MPKKLLFSITLKDCKVETFTCGGKGGSGKDTSNNGVRIRHLASGAVGEARDSRDQLRNKRAAFKRMAESTAFKAWVRLESARIATGKTVEQIVDEELEKKNLKVEKKTPLGWEVWKEPSEIEKFSERLAEGRARFEAEHYGTPDTPAYAYVEGTQCVTPDCPYPQWDVKSRDIHHYCLKCWDDKVAGSIL